MYPVGKIPEKAVCRSVFLTMWHCIFSAHSFRLFFWRFCPLGMLWEGYLFACCQCWR